MFGSAISNMMIKPGSSPVFGSPADYGLEFEEVAFQARDGVTLAGWLVKGDPSRVIVQSHFGVQSSRAGFTPEGKGMIKLWKSNIPFLEHVRHLVQSGYSVLMYDFRNHGASGASSRPWVSWGPEEHKDVVAAVEYLTGHPVYRSSKIGLLSLCMGAAASTYAYGADPGLGQYDQIKAMLAVQPLLYPDFSKALGIPGFLNRAADKVNLERTGIDLTTKSFMPHVKDIRVPTMVVQNRNDPWANLDAVQHYYDQLTVEKELVWLELSKERAAAYAHLGEHPQIASDFFGRYL